MSHAYKKVAPVVPSLSFVKAVLHLGDLWFYSPEVPWEVKRNTHTAKETSDSREAALMSVMEIGAHSREGFADDRIEVRDYTNAYPRILLDFNGLCYTAVRDGHDMEDPSGSDEWSKFWAIWNLLEQEEWRAEDQAARAEARRVVAAMDYDAVLLSLPEDQKRSLLEGSWTETER